MEGREVDVARSETDARVLSTVPSRDRSWQPVLLAGLVVTVVAILTVWSIATTTPIDSDDAARPVMLDSIFRVGFSGALLPEDMYFTRAPIYLVGQIVGGGLGREAIDVGYVLMGVAIAAVAVVLHRVIVGRIVWLPAVASAVTVVALTPINLSIVRSSHRGLEVLGAMAAATWLAGRASDLGGHRGRAALALVLLSICLSSEPYGVWLVALPLAGLVCLDAVLHRSVRRAEPSVWLVGGVVGAQVLNLAIEAIGVDIHHFDKDIDLANAVSPSKWGNAMRAARRALLGGHGFTVTDLLPIAVAVLIVAVIAMVVVVCWRSRRPSPIQLYAALYPVLVLAAYVVTPNIDVPGSFRYIAPLMLSFPLGVAVIIASGDGGLARSTRALASVAAVVAVANLAVFTARFPLPESDELQERSIDALLAEAKSSGLEYGYASYWNSHRATAFAGGDVTVIPVICGDDGTLVFYDWVANREATKRTGPGFLLIDETIVDCLSNVDQGEILWKEPELGWTMVALDGPPPGTVYGDD